MAGLVPTAIGQGLELGELSLALGQDKVRLRGGLDAPGLALGLGGLHHEDVRGLLHDGTGGVDGVAHAIGTRDSAAATVASHDAAVHLRPALARKGCAAARVELRGVLHHMHAGNNGIEGAAARVEHCHGGIEGALDVCSGLLLALGREGMTTTAGATVDDDDRLAGSAFSGIDDRSLSHLSDLSCDVCD